MPKVALISSGPPFQLAKEELQKVRAIAVLQSCILGVEPLPECCCLDWPDSRQCQLAFQRFLAVRVEQR